MMRLALLPVFVLVAPLVAGPAAAHEHEWAELHLDRAPAGIMSPGLALPDVAGRTVRLEDFRGRPVLLNFWATWCTPCEMEMPAMERLHRLSVGRVAVLSVNFRESAERVRAFGRERGLTFPMLLDADGATFARYAVEALPFSVLLDGDGRVRAAARGPRDWDSATAAGLFERLARERR